MRLACSISCFKSSNSMDLQDELQKLFNRPVDIVQKKELNNPYRRQEILKTNQLVYGQK